MLGPGAKCFAPSTTIFNTNVPPGGELGDPVPRVSRGQLAQGRPLHTGVRRREAHAGLVRTGELAIGFADLPARAAPTGGYIVVPVRAVGGGV